MTETSEGVGAALFQLGPEQIKNRNRVRDLAEVYTHEREVSAMLDMVSGMFPSDGDPGTTTAPSWSRRAVTATSWWRSSSVLTESTHKSISSVHLNVPLGNSIVCILGVQFLYSLILELFQILVLMQLFDHSMNSQDTALE